MGLHAAYRHGTIVPRVVPFQISLKQAQSTFEERQQSHWLAPSKLLNKGLVRMHAALLPFWLFEATVHVEYTGAFCITSLALILPHRLHFAYSHVANGRRVHLHDLALISDTERRDTSECTHRISVHALHIISLLATTAFMYTCRHTLHSTSACYAAHYVTPIAHMKAVFSFSW